MKTVSKKLFSLLLVVVLLVSAVPFQVFAAETGNDPIDPDDGIVTPNVGDPENTPAPIGEGDGDDDDDDGAVTPPPVEDIVMVKIKVGTISVPDVALKGNRGDAIDILGAAGVKAAIENRVPSNVSDYEFVSATGGYKDKALSAEDLGAFTLEGNTTVNLTYRLLNPKTFKVKFVADSTVANALIDTSEGAAKVSSVEREFTFGGTVANIPGAKCDGYETTKLWKIAGSSTNFENVDLLKPDYYAGKAAGDVILTVEPRFVKKTASLTVIGVKVSLSGTSYSTVYSETYKVPDSYAGNAREYDVLDFIKDNEAKIKGDVTKNTPAGHEWTELWCSNRSGTKVEQGTDIGHEYTVYVRYVPIEYTVYFDANGGKIPDGHHTSKTVKFGGDFSIATPTWKGKIFLGWQDANGILNKPSSDGKTYIKKYDIPDDSTYTAVWDDTAGILLRVYSSRKSTALPYIIPVPNKTYGDWFTIEEAEKLVKARFSGVSTVVGMFDEDGWEAYVNHGDSDGKRKSIRIEKKDSYTEISVYASGVSPNGSSGTTSSSKPADPTNAQTGDQAKPEIAAIVMGSVAAIAVIAGAVYVVRKKKNS